MSEANKALLTVVNVMLVCMMSVQIVGLWYDACQDKKVARVACSKDIVDRARNLNITLMGECEIEI